MDLNQEWTVLYTYGYIRESGEKQVASGLGEEAQRVAVQRYYEASIAPRGVEWGRFFQDLAVSASKRMFARRPEARELLRVVRPGDHIVTAFSSRAFRNTRDCLNTEAILTQMGVTLHCLDIAWDTSTPTGRAMRQMMAVVDELSSGMTSDRNRAVAEVLKSQGRRAGGPGGKKVPLAKPYGYDLHHRQCRQENPNGRIDLGDHMRGFLEFYAGRRKPSHMSQEDYEHCVGRHGAEHARQCQETLEKYSLE